VRRVEQDALTRHMIMGRLNSGDLVRLAVVVPLAWLVIHAVYNADVSFYRGPNVAWHDDTAGLQRIEVGLSGDDQDNAN
jgi:hypothetical protein